MLLPSHDWLLRCSVGCQRIWEGTTQICTVREAGLSAVGPISLGGVRSCEINWQLLHALNPTREWHMV